jgi:hypothetical protein
MRLRSEASLVKNRLPRCPSNDYAQEMACHVLLLYATLVLPLLLLFPLFVEPADEFLKLGALFRS